MIYTLCALSLSHAHAYHGRSVYTNTRQDKRDQRDQLDAIGVGRLSSQFVVVITVTAFTTTITVLLLSLVLCLFLFYKGILMLSHDYDFLFFSNITAIPIEFKWILHLRFGCNVPYWLIAKTKLWKQIWSQGAVFFQFYFTQILS